MLLRDGYTANFTNHSFSLTTDGAWHKYSYNFTGKDTSITSTTAQLNFSMTCNGGVVYVDNATLGKTNGTGYFRAEILQILQDIGVGSIRDIDNTAQIAGIAFNATQGTGSSYTMPPLGMNISGGVQITNSYSYNDLAKISGAVSPYTSPWITIGMALTDADYTTYGNDFCSLESTYNFPNIWVECNNENWSGAQSFEKTSSLYSYGQACYRAFQLISAACPDSQIHYLLDNQTANGGVLQEGLSGPGLANIPNTSQYGASENLYLAPVTLSGSESITNAITAAITANTNRLVPALGYTFSGDNYYLCLNSAGSGDLNPCNRSMGTYEWSISAAASANPLLSSQLNVGWGSAGIAMQTLLLGLTVPNPAQAITTSNQFLLPNTVGNVSGTNYLLWGVSAGYAGTDEDFAPVWPWLRPNAQLLQLWNKVIGTNTNYNAVSLVPSGVLMAAFSRNNNYQVAGVNTNSTPVTIRVTFPPGTRPPSYAGTINYARDLADNNENSSSTTLGPLTGGISYSGQTATFTVPAFAPFALLQNSGAVPIYPIPSDPI
jgi:hypothetical protein